jgi:hypothetical protein
MVYTLGTNVGRLNTYMVLDFICVECGKTLVLILVVNLIYLCSAGLMHAFSKTLEFAAESIQWLITCNNFLWMYCIYSCGRCWLDIRRGPLM